MISGLCRRLVRGVVRSQSEPAWKAAAGSNWTERILSLPVTDDYHEKQGRSTGRWIIPNGNGLSVYLKRHYRLAWWQRVLATLDPRGDWSPASREMRNLLLARAKGVLVPCPVAMAEFIGPWFRLQSALAVAELKGMLPLHIAIPLARRHLEAPRFRRWKDGLIDAVVGIALRLHHSHCFHKDFYLCHFYLPEEDTRRIPPEGFRSRLYLIDLHRLRRHKWWSWYWQVKDLAQLLYSSEVDGITPRDRIRFWRLYRGRKRNTAARWMERIILWKWQRYRRHNARKKPVEQANTEKAAA